MEQLNKAKESLISKGIEKADIGIVLGTGLSRIIDFVNIITNYSLFGYPGISVVYCRIS